MDNYRVSITMESHQVIQEFSLMIQASSVMDAQFKAIRTLNNCLSYAPIDEYVKSMHVFKR